MPSAGASAACFSPAMPRIRCRRSWRKGLCSGFRDAHNLAWKLDLVLKGLAPAKLPRHLRGRAWTECARHHRRKHARRPERQRARSGEGAAARRAASWRCRRRRSARADEKQLIAFRVPGFTAGFIARNGARGAGDALGARARARATASEGRFDDIAGHGFMIVTRGGGSGGGTVGERSRLLAIARRPFRAAGGTGKRRRCDRGHRRAIWPADGRIRLRRDRQTAGLLHLRRLSEPARAAGAAQPTCAVSSAKLFSGTNLSATPLMQ